MINALFSNNTVTAGDTVSYCGNSEYSTSIGTGSSIALEWGIMLPASVMNGNYLKSAMIYVVGGYEGLYTLNLYRGGDTIPGTLAHTQSVNLTTSGWNEVLLDTTFPLDSLNLWVTFTTVGAYPMAACDYTGSANSDWIYLEGVWSHIVDYELDFSWMIKAVTSATAPALPAPAVSIEGQYQIAKGQPYTYTATGTEGATITWSLPGATPSTATGNSVTATWNTTGEHAVIATISNAYGTGTDTLWNYVVDYTVGDTVSYALNRPHFSQVGGAPFSWGIMLPSAFLTNRNYLNAVQVGIELPGSYTLRIYQGGDTVPQTLAGTYSITVTAADTAQEYTTFDLPTPLALSTSQNLWIVVSHTMGSGLYPARTCYSIIDQNSDWITLDDTAWYHLYELGIDNSSWMIKAITSTSYTPPVTQYTVTVTSNNDAWGMVSGGGTYNEGDTITLSATANNGYHFVQWQDGSTDNPRTVTVTANATYTATFAVNAVPGNCDVTSLPWNYSFITDSISDCWTNIDADGDSLYWMYIANYGAVSFSYISDGETYEYSLTPDNWLISPKVTLPATGADFHYTYMNMAADYPDHIGIFVSTTNTDPSSFTLLEQYTAVPADTVWQTRTVSLAAYAGQQVYIAIRHYNSDDNYAFIVGSVSITAGSTPVQQYTITATSADATMGSVTGGGTYNAGSTVTLTATANSGYHFVQWQDGNTANPRTITVIGNATYTATFEANVSIDNVNGLSVVLYPNPANGYVTLSALPAAARITIIDAAGRLCGSWPSQGEQTTLDISHLSAGQYYLRITGEGLNTVKKLVVE